MSHFEHHIEQRSGWQLWHVVCMHVMYIKSCCVVHSKDVPSKNGEINLKAACAWWCWMVGPELGVGECQLVQGWEKFAQASHQLFPTFSLKSVVREEGSEMQLVQATQRKWKKRSQGAVGVEP